MASFMFRLWRKKKRDLPLYEIEWIDSGSSWYSLRAHLIRYLATGGVHTGKDGRTCFSCTILEGSLKGQNMYIHNCEVKRMTKQHQVVCRCEQYGFPHRAFSGKCTGTEVEQFAYDQNKCNDCEHFVAETQTHPYGMGEATEDISYCGLLMQDEHDWLVECPALEPRRKRWQS